MNVTDDMLAAGPLLGAQAALAARLRAYFPTPRFVHAALPPRLTKANWSDLLRRTPFVGLGWEALRPDVASGRILAARAQFLVVLVVRNLASHEARLMGDRVAPGLLGMVQVAAAALHGWTILGTPGRAEPVGDVRVEGVANLHADDWSDEAAAMAGLSISVGVNMATPDRLDELLRLGALWQIDDAADGAPAPDDLIEVTS